MSRILVVEDEPAIQELVAVNLEHAGHRVRCLARRPETLRGRVGAGTEVVQGDCLDPASLAAALLLGLIAWATIPPQDPASPSGPPAPTPAPASPLSSAWMVQA